jgi:hypothetical protein
MGAARGLPVEKCDIFLQRIAAMLALRGNGRFTDTDVADVAQLALAIEIFIFIGGRTGTRTLDPLIKSQLLSPTIDPRFKPVTARGGKSELIEAKAVKKSAGPDKTRRKEKFQ